MTATLLLSQYIYLTTEFGVRMNAVRFCQNLAALHLFAVNTTQQSTNVVAGLSKIKQFAEHLNAGYNGALRLIHQTYDGYVVANLNLTALHTAGYNSAAAGDGEYVLNRHQERFVNVTLRCGDILVHCVHQIPNRFAVGAIAAAATTFQCFQSGTGDNRNIVAREFILAQQLANFHFHQFHQFVVVNLVGFVQEYHDIGYANLTGQQNVLTSLRHRAVGGRYYQDSAVHLSCAGNHVLNIVGVARAVHVGIVTAFGFIFYVRSVNRDTTSSLLRSRVNLVISLGFSAAGCCQTSGNGRCQCGLAVVNVTNRADINMRLCAFKLLFCHVVFPPF